MPGVDEAKAALVRAAHLLFETGTVSRSGHGNMSARLDADRIVISAVGNLRGIAPDDFAVVSLGGKVLEGHLDPANREIVAMHTEAYRTRETVGSIIHTHATNATAFAVANRDLPVANEAMLRFGFLDAVPVAPWAPRGSRESVTNITEQMRAHPRVPAVLLGNHGVLAFHKDPVSTTRVIVAMEEGAELVLRARLIGGEQPFPPGALEREQEHMRAHGSHG